MVDGLTCYLCGNQGTYIYRNRRDLLFGVPGKWDLRKCANIQCGLVWLDPMPPEQDREKLYRVYYTHGDEGVDRMKETLPTRFVQRVLRLPYSVLKRIMLIRHERKRLNLMYLDALKPGRLLEVGCGNGDRLVKLKKLGWDVEGQEVDLRAASHAREKHGLRIFYGDLDALSLPENVYDAVVLNHVIEHVHDPAGLLSECRRVLKPGGMLVAVTPNSESYGHRTFQSHWFGLDPPRHLYLFSERTLERVAARAGFRSHRVWTTASKAETFAKGSMELTWKGREDGKKISSLSLSTKAMLFQLKATAHHRVQPFSGEECVLRALK